MSKIAYIVDSTTLLDKKITDNLRVETVSLSVNIESLNDKEVNISDEVMLGYIKQGKLGKSAAPSPEDFASAYMKLFNEGYEEIVVVPLSKRLSGTYQVCLVAKTLDTIPEDKAEHIHVIDINTCNFAISNIFNCLYEDIKDEDDVNKVVQLFNDVSPSSKTMFTILDLKHLFNGGRLSRLSCFIGTLLKIKPVIAVEDGKLGLAHKKRKDSDIIELFVNAINELKTQFKKLYVRIIHLNNPDKAKIIEEKIQTNDGSVIISHISRVGAVFNVHLGDNGYGITLCGKNF